MGGQKAPGMIESLESLRLQPRLGIGTVSGLTFWSPSGRWPEGRTGTGSTHAGTMQRVPRIACRALQRLSQMKRFPRRRLDKTARLRSVRRDWSLSFFVLQGFSQLEQGTRKHKTGGKMHALQKHARRRALSFRRRAT